MENRTLYYQSIKSLEYIFSSIGKTEKPVYYKRLIEELINTKYSGYFLIVSDFILWTKTIMYMSVLGEDQVLVH